MKYLVKDIKKSDGTPSNPRVLDVDLDGNGINDWVEHGMPKIKGAAVTLPVDLLIKIISSLPDGCHTNMLIGAVSVYLGDAARREIDEYWRGLKTTTEMMRHALNFEPKN